MSDPRRTGTPLRRARGAVVGLVASSVAVGGHVLAGGEAVTPAVVAALVLVVAGSVVASSSRWTLPRLLVAVSAGQPAVHGVLWLTSPTSGLDPRLGGAAAHPGHGHAGAGAAMLLAHATAVLVAALLLAALERCALSLWALVHAARLATSRVTVPSALRLPAVVPAYAAPGTGRVVLSVRPRRGPPSLLAPC